ncbi:MAG: hydrogenase nickel incorporation protein HypB [Ignavibacteriae bacterium]|nr:hydrogenase nickel incorporation protein HypB [Ignavibacteriota bacterium]
MSLITVERKILEKNDEIANINREKFRFNGMFTMNLVSSPGSGKTSLIEQTINVLKHKMKIAVIEGDVQTNLDAQRIDALGVPVVQIVTNGSCHLDAMLVRDAYQKLVNIDINLLFIENVGNLVCPAAYDLGEDMKVVIISTTEGDDKPLKYPAIFHNSRVLLINKIDLLPYLKCNIDTIINNAHSINPSLKIFEVSCSTREGIDEWCNYLLSRF